MLPMQTNKILKIGRDIEFFTQRRSISKLLDSTLIEINSRGRSNATGDAIVIYMKSAFISWDR